MSSGPTCGSLGGRRRAGFVCHVVHVASRLSGLDASFIYAETERAHMHTLKLLLLDAAGFGPGADPLQECRLALRGALRDLPHWRSVLDTAGPLADHPRWVACEDFELDDHVRGIHLLEGTDAALDDLIGKLMSEALPRNRPLWQAVVVTGIPRRVALVFKIHHSLADGVAFSRVLDVLTTRSPECAAARSLVPAEESLLSRSSLTRLAMTAWLRRIAALPSLCTRTVMAAIRRTWSRLQADMPTSVLFRGPKARFNGPLSGTRKFARAKVALDDLKAVKDVYEVTLNDVVMDIAAAAIRQWQAAHGGSLDRPLVAGVPVTAETEADRDRRSGNKVAHIPVLLHTDIDDDVERLQAIHRSTGQAKLELEFAGPELLQRWSELARPATLRAIWEIVPHLPRPPINLVVANVPGPRETIYFGGAEVVDLWSVGPILEGIGLNITAWSYRGRLTFGVQADAELVADVSTIARALERAASWLRERAELEAREDADVLQHPSASAAARVS